MSKKTINDSCNHRKASCQTVSGGQKAECLPNGIGGVPACQDTKKRSPRDTEFFPGYHFRFEVIASNTSRFVAVPFRDEDGAELFRRELEEENLVSTDYGCIIKPLIALIVQHLGISDDEVCAVNVSLIDGQPE